MADPRGTAGDENGSAGHERPFLPVATGL